MKYNRFVEQFYAMLRANRQLEHSVFVVDAELIQQTIQVVFDLLIVVVAADVHDDLGSIAQTIWVKVSCRYCGPKCRDFAAVFHISFAATAAKIGVVVAADYIRLAAMAASVCVEPFVRKETETFVISKWGQFHINSFILLRELP